MKVTVQELSVERSGRQVLNEVSMLVGEGDFVGVIGPNGAGKSTLLRAIAGLISPSHGAVFLGTDRIDQLSRLDVAKRIALLDQHQHSALALKVRDIVELGTLPNRHAHRHMRRPTNIKAFVDSVLDDLGLTDLASRQWGTLSGGQKQRVALARAMAQKPSVLLLDEPTNHLDITAQLDIMNRVKDLNITVIAALHDLNHAAHFCNAIAILSEGKLTGWGSPREVMTVPTISRVYGVDATVLEHPDGRPVIAWDAPGSPQKGT